MKANLPILFCALIAGAALTTLATTTQSRTTFEYLVVKGIRPNDARDKNNSLDPRLTAAGAEGYRLPRTVPLLN
ncbi:MAG: hypothetical protein J0L84_20230, partial [Verrucomicrobia bacterium]|nr:hypothetical protein [Verrucomicrobiota bacterium]